VRGFSLYRQCAAHLLLARVLALAALHVHELTFAGLAVVAVVMVVMVVMLATLVMGSARDGGSSQRQRQRTNSDYDTS